MNSWARHLAFGLLLSVAIPAGAARAADSAEQILLDKANYWRLKDRPDLARDSLNKLLTLNPNQPDALFQFGILEIQQGNLADARRYLGRLQQVAPGDLRAGELETAIQAGRLSPTELGEARRLGQSGQFTQAVQKYRQTFNGPAPATFGVEYYMTLAATPQGREQARRELERLALTSPNDPKIKLALAEVSTYGDATRAEGIAALARLSRDPAVGPTAVRAWHQALMWLGGTPDDRALYRQYLAQYPQDTEIRQHLADAEKENVVVAGAGDTAQTRAYAELKRGNVAVAERQFTADLSARPDDPAALAGLGLVRLRQDHFAEARDYLGRAMRADPARQSQWASAHDSAAFWAVVQEAKTLRAAGNYQRARSILASLLTQPRNDNWGAELVLADIEAKLGNRPAAEQAYRRVLAARPQNGDALVGLVNVLTASGRTAEATAMTSRLGAVDRARLGGGATAQAETLRIAAKESDARGDKAAARVRFQQALAADPKNPWIRLDFARFLAGEGALAQGFATVDPGESGNTPAAFQAAAIFDSQQDRPADALAKIERIPASSRTAEINALRASVAAAGTIERAKMLANAGKRVEARELLVALYRDRSVKSDGRNDIPRILAELGEADIAAQLYRDAARERSPEGLKAAVDYGWLLLKRGRDAEVATLVAQTDARDGARADLEFARLKVAVAVRKADALRRRGDLARAYDQLAPLLGANPNDSTLLVAVGRIHGDSRQYREALRYYETAHRENPGDIDVLAAVIEGAIQAREIERARGALAQALGAYPSNARLYYLQAQLARAEGDTKTALQALETARVLNGVQAPTVGEGSSGTSVPPQTTPPSAPRRGSQSELPGGAPTLLASAGSSAPQSYQAAPGMPELGRSADSDDLAPRSRSPDALARGGAAHGRAATRVQLASLVDGPLYGSDAAADDTLPAPARPEAVVVPRSEWGRPEQIAQVELEIPPPVGGYQPPVDRGPTPGPGQEQESLQLDIERSMVAIEAESAPMLTAGAIFRGREGQSGLSQLIEIGAPIEVRYSPWLTGTLRMSVNPVYIDAGSVSSASLPLFGANQYLSAAGLTQAQPSDQNTGGVLASLGYAYGPYSAKIGVSAWGFPVTNWTGNVAYQPKFWNDTLTVRVEGLRQPVTDSLLSYAGTRASLTAANTATGGTFGRDSTWGGVTKTGGRLSVFYDDGDIGAYMGTGLALLDGTNVPQNSTFDGYVGTYFRPYKSGDDQLKVGVNFAYFSYDRNLGFYSFGQGGYFSPRNFEALTFPVEYQGRSGRWSYLASVALGVQRFNQRQSAFFPNNKFAQQALEGLAGSNAYYAGGVTSGIAAGLRGQVEYALSNTFAVGASGSFDNGRSFNEGVAKVYFRKTFADPVMPGAFPKPDTGNP